MAEIDDELVARALRWCADAGRQATAGEVRRALAPLSWDALLAARALLADPPPARPLGPQALADLARGADPATAAERERGGRYAREGAADPLPGGALPPRGRGTRRRAPRGRALVIHRARDRAAPPPAAPPRSPRIDELFAPAGRAVLEGLIRRKGAVAALLVPVLAAGWRLGDGGAPAEADLRALLDAHGLLRAFERRERAAALHALRAAGGVMRRAASALSLDPAGLGALLSRTGAAAEAEAVRERRRATLRSRATLASRARLILEDAETLADLGLLAEFEVDLRSRMPEHLKALRAAGGAPLAALSRSLSLPPAATARLARGLGLELQLDAGRVSGRPGAASARPPREVRQRAGGRPAGAPRPGPPGRRRPAGPRASPGRRQVPEPRRRPGQRRRPPL